MPSSSPLGWCGGSWGGCSMPARMGSGASSTSRCISRGIMEMRGCCHTKGYKELWRASTHDDTDPSLSPMMMTFLSSSSDPNTLITSPAPSRSSKTDKLSSSTRGSIGRLIIFCLGTKLTVTFLTPLFFPSHNNPVLPLHSHSYPPSSYQATFYSSVKRYYNHR